MKKLINTAFVYALGAMAAGVFFREVTRMLNYTSRTYLSLAHGHLFLLGTLFFLIVALLSKFIDFAETGSFRKAYLVYNVGLIWTVALFLVHGWMEVQGLDAALRKFTVSFRFREKIKSWSIQDLQGLTASFFYSPISLFLY